MRATGQHELRLDAPAGFRLPPLGGLPLEARVFTSVYYDVPGGSLAAAGITLLCRTERGRTVWQLKLPAEESRLELEEEGGPGATAALRCCSFSRRICATGRSSASPSCARGVAASSSRANGTTAEVTVDEVAVLDEHRVRDRFVEVELELRSGSPAHLDSSREELAAAGAEPRTTCRRRARPSPLGLADRGACASLLREQLREIERHDPGTRLGRDPESLHDMRVAVRRTRALLRAGKKLIAADMSELDGRLKELGAVLGEVRDLDVLLARLEDEAGELGGEDAKQARSLLAALRTERSCSRRAPARGASLAAVPLAARRRCCRRSRTLEPSGAAVTLDDVADRAFAKARKAVHALPDEPADAELHRVRKLGKRARYAGELGGTEGVRPAGEGVAGRPRRAPGRGGRGGAAPRSSPRERRPGRRSRPAVSSNES